MRQRQQTGCCDLSISGLQLVTRDFCLPKRFLIPLGYEDVGCLKLLREGAALAGDIEPTKAFKSQILPGSTTLQRLTIAASKRNAMILSMTKRTGDKPMDEQLVLETEEEVAKGWAVGSIPVEDLPEGALISRRFALQQGSKTRMIDDYSVSSIKDSACLHNKIDLHMIDTFCAVVKRYFEQCGASGLVGKTYDLKSAYRQVPANLDHLQYSFFSILNYGRDCTEVYQLLTLPFGAVHSVYTIPC